MPLIVDFVISFMAWVISYFISQCTDNTSHSVVNSVEQDVLGTPKGTTNVTRLSTTSDDSYNSLIKKLAEKNSVAAENQDLKIQLTKLQIELALSDNKNRKLKHAQDELEAFKRAMEFLEEENIRLINKETELRRVIENKDRLLDVISGISSDNNRDEIDHLLDDNLINLKAKNKQILRLFAESETKTFKQVPSGCDEPVQSISDFAITPATTEVSDIKSTNDETLVEQHQPTVDSNNGLIEVADGRMMFEGNKAEVAYFINGQRSYQKEEEPVPAIAMDGVFVADWINASPAIGHAPSVPEAVAVHQQNLSQETSQRTTTEEIQQKTTTTHLENSVEVKNPAEDSPPCETNPLTRKQKTNQRTNRRRKARKVRDAASTAE
jgi:hypothetical protein